MEAATEAETMPEVTNVISNEDMKRAVKNSCKKKWQRRCEMAVLEMASGPVAKCA